MLTQCVLGLNMQKAYTQEGVALVGHAALQDTMGDIITDATAALLVSVVGYISSKRKKTEGLPETEI